MPEVLAAELINIGTTLKRDSLVPDRGCAISVNINSTCARLPLACAANLLMAIDVHTTNAAHQAYHADYMRHSTILFQADERLPRPLEDRTHTMSHKAA